ncbi:MAG: Holliday junction branch migration protein RuvA [Oscillospiraceae bacterium]|nr:Holliday junction branch migration protein RuvA [Oscillospiraceae bacterium]
MFYYLEGNVALMDVNLAVIDVGGAGYACNASTNTLSYLEVGKKARLYTYCNIKEDAFDIFGFYNMAEKRAFEQLISVSGVGPKAALSILSVCTPEVLAMSIINDDYKMLTAAPGVGKRIAQRIVLELKDKMSKEAASLQATGFVPAASAPADKVNDAVSALTVLGYTPAEITAALRLIDTDSLSVEEIIREVLKGSVKQ